MSNKQETVETVAAEMRNESHAGDESCLEWVGAKMRTYADRFEAAHQREVAELKSKMNDVVCENEALRDACGTCGVKREREATREKSSQVGNAAKMREALSDACYAMFNFLKTQNGGYEEMAKALDKAKATLAEPPRNCDRPECATTKAAQEVWRKEDGGKTAYYEWLLATYTEGETTNGKKH